MSTNVWVKCGKTHNLQDAVTTTATGTSKYKDAPLCTVQASGSTTASTGAAVISVQVSNDDSNWLTAGTITLTLGTTTTTDGVVINAPWKYIRTKVDSISGTGASVSTVMGV